MPVASFSNYNQRLVWKLCASIYREVAPADAIEKHMKLRCSFEENNEPLFPYYRETRESKKFLVLKIESKFKIYNVLFKPQRHLYVIEEENGALSLCKLPCDISSLNDSIIYEYASDEDQYEEE